MVIALQIANPVVVKKVERLAQAVGLSKTAAVERAVDRLLSELVDAVHTKNSANASMAALLVQLDQVGDRPDAFDSLAWDANGLPK